MIIYGPHRNLPQLTSILPWQMDSQFTFLRTPQRSTTQVFVSTTMMANNGQSERLWRQHASDLIWTVSHRFSYTEVLLHSQLCRHGWLHFTEDELIDQANILIIWSFSDFLARRLANIETSTFWADARQSFYYLCYPNILDLGTNQKGWFLNIGLWMHLTDSQGLN